MTRSVIKIKFLLTEVQTTFMAYTIHLMCLLPHLNLLKIRVGYENVRTLKKKGRKIFIWMTNKLILIYKDDI